MHGDSQPVLPPSPPRTRAVDLALLWSGQLLSALGDQLHQVALMWIAVSVAGARAGLVAAAGTAARLIFGLLGGVYSDRWDKRRAMIAADLARAALVGALALAGARGMLGLGSLALVAAALGAIDALFQPALQASLPALTPEPQALMRMNAALNVNHRIALVVGPSLTGVLLGWTSITSFFAFDAASFIASALAIAALGRRYRWKASGPSRKTSGRVRAVLREIAGAARLVVAHPWMGAAFLALACSNVAWAAVVVGAPLLARDVLQGGPETYGYLMGGYGVGNVLANVILAVRPPRRRARVFFAGGLIFSAGVAALGSAQSLPVAMLLGAVAALGGPMQDLMVLHALQSDVRADQIGKVFSLRVLISQFGYGVGLVLVGPVFAALPVQRAMVVMAMPSVVLAALGLIRFRDG